jgi:chemotaxis protein MotA
MDIATFIGLLGALGLIAAAMATGGGIGGFVDVPSALIVIGGTFMAVMSRSTMAEFIGSFKALIKSFFPKLPKLDEAILKITELAVIARKDGMMALDGQEIPEPFFEHGLKLLIDGVDKEGLTIQMKNQITSMEQRHAGRQDAWQAWIDLAPAMGMIGTLVGLVQMLGNMSDPQSIGPAMAVALLTTLYGAMIANVIANPVLAKLKTYSQEELLYRKTVLRGLQMITEGENPRNIQDQLSMILSAGEREKMVQS